MTPNSFLEKQCALPLLPLPFAALPTFTTIFRRRGDIYDFADSSTYVLVAGLSLVISSFSSINFTIVKIIMRAIYHAKTSMPFLPP